MPITRPRIYLICSFDTGVLKGEALSRLEDVLLDRENQLLCDLSAKQQASFAAAAAAAPAAADIDWEYHKSRVLLQM